MSGKMGLQELAQYTYRGLKDEGIDVTLSGGACVSLYTENAYQSSDLDFIRGLSDKIEKVSVVMEKMGFHREGRHFTHPRSEFTVEFPQPPISVGNEKPRQVVENIFRTKLGKLPVKMLSPTDCIKDRLCGYFYWNDLPSLEQAIMVAYTQEVDLKEIKAWANREGMGPKYEEFKKALMKKRKKQEA